MGPPTDPPALGQCPSFQMVSPPLGWTDLPNVSFMILGLGSIFPASRSSLIL
ncbi:unnamed protein product [Staurois parvus]|uniref:Uncharacterized protein n=1 Tax=Staurois parvus TaxID=386267 RepID=A0ABN9GQA9_9NEOB|nr:unnamed protein product [Staurois parvus]